jgi:hypothetical protein
LEILKGPVNNRHIWWIYDAAGGTGKSRLTEHIVKELNGIEVDGRIADISYGYNGERIVVFDLSRAVSTLACDELYNAAEKLKNGRLFSTKYDSKAKTFPSPHVVFMSNSPPPVGKWSADRLQLITLSEPAAFKPLSEFPAVQVEHVEPQLSAVEQFHASLKKRKLEEIEHS